MPGKYEGGIASVMTRASMRAGKRDGTACFLAYEEDSGDLRFGLGFSDGPGRPFETIELSEEEQRVLDTIFTEWEHANRGQLPWIDLVVVTKMSPRGPNGVEMGASTIPRSLLKDRQRAEGRRMAHAEPMAVQMGRIAPMALAKRGRLG